MSDPKRNRILWLDRSPPKSVAEVAAQWGLILADSKEFDPLGGMGELLAVFIPTAVLSSVPTSKLLAAEDHGVFCAVVAKGTGVPGSVEFAAADGELKQRAKIEGCRLDFVRVLHAHPQVLMRECLRHDPGPSANPALEIVADPKQDAATEVLLKRVFTAFHRISLRRLDGGRSGTGDVWQVDASHEDGRQAEPFIVKIGQPDALLEERRFYEHSVRHYVPFPCRPSLMKSGCLRGASTAILASMFVTRAQRLDDYVRSVQSPELAMTALFVGAMRTWRTTRSHQLQRLGDVYVNDPSSRRVLPAEPDRLQAAYALAHKEDPTVLAPRELFKALAELPPMEYFECYGHGDLNSRNAFVRAGGADVVLIDFSHVGYMPASRDPSRLEVSLAFDVCGHGKSFIEDSALRELYTTPLLPCHPVRDTRDGRIAAIRQIRCHTGGDGVGCAEYEVSTACHLLRYAREASMEHPNTAVEIAERTGSSEEIRLRRTAYLCAARLIRHRYDSLKPIRRARGARK